MIGPSVLNNIFDPNSPVFIALPVVFLVFKVLFLAAFAIYVIYALVIVRQISLMARTVSALLEGFLKLIGIVHLLAAITVFILAFFA